MTDLATLLRIGAFVSAAALATTAQSQSRDESYSGDYIAVVVNNELVTAGEIDQRTQRARAAAARSGGTLPGARELRREVLDALIDERVVVTYARENSPRVDEVELDRAVASVAQQNKWTLDELRQRLSAEGIDYARFRAGLRDQIMVERVREREVSQRTRITDAEIDAYLAKLNLAGAKDEELNIAQILVAVPEGADAATLAQRTERAQAALARVLAGEDFATVAREVSDDASRASGGELGLRPASRLPDVFVAQVRPLQPGAVSPTLLRTGAGLHVLKLIDRRDTVGMQVTQTHPRHILLRPSAQVSAEMAKQRLADYRAQIVSGANSFENLARLYSEDGSAAQGGDLGWVSPGSLVPEFEEAMNALAVGGLSQPVVSRFGVHLIQVVDRREATLDEKQLREQARNALRGQKYEQAYREWVAELRGRAYIEAREPPQ